MKPDFPSLADEIAIPHPDMNIKVAAFTVSEKSSNTNLTEGVVSRTNKILNSLQKHTLNYITRKFRN